MLFVSCMFGHLLAQSMLFSVCYDSSSACGKKIDIATVLPHKTYIPVYDGWHFLSAAHVMSNSLQLLPALFA